MSWRTRTRVIRIQLVIPFVLTVVTLLPATAAAQYVAIGLGSLNGPLGFSWAHAVNNKGQVVGRTATPGGSQHAFLWEDGVMRDLGTLPGGSHSEAFAINDRGQVVGWSTIDEDSCTLFDGCWHAFLWEDGTMTDLGALDNRFQSYAYSINDHGQIVGISSTGDYPDGVWRAVMWDNGSISGLGEVPGAINSFAYGINDKVQIAGSWNDALTTRPLLWSDGSTVPLPTLPGATFTEAYEINKRGVIVGSGNSAASAGNQRAVLWANGTVTDLGTLPAGVWSIARDINDRGDVVGESFIASQGNRAFVWDRTMVALPGGIESYASGINARGVIVGASSNGQVIQAVLWTKRP